MVYKSSRPARIRSFQRKIGLALAAGLILFFTGCPEPIDEALVTAVEDVIAPVLTIVHPVENSEYSSIVSFEINLTDDSTIEGDGLGAIKSIAYDLSNDEFRGGKINIAMDGTITVDTNAGPGEIIFDRDTGKATFEFSTIEPNRLTGLIVVTITVVDVNNNTVVEKITIRESEGLYVRLVDPGTNYTMFEEYDILDISGIVADTSEQNSADEIKTLSWKVVGKSWEGTLNLTDWLVPAGTEWLDDDDGNPSTVHHTYWRESTGEFITLNEGASTGFNFPFSYNPSTMEFASQILAPTSDPVLIFEFRAEDLNNHITLAIYSIPLNAVGPEIVITKPSLGGGSSIFVSTDNYGNAPILIEGIAADPASVDSLAYFVRSNKSADTQPDIVSLTPIPMDGDGNFSFYINGDSAGSVSPINNDGTFISTINGWTASLMTVTLIAKDSSARETKPSFIATVDNVGPSVVLSDGEADEAVKNGETITVTATFTDDAGVDDTVSPPQITIGSTHVDQAMTKISNLIWRYSWPVPAGNDGAAPITIEAYDGVGNPNAAATGRTSYVIDNTAPDVSLTSSDADLLIKDTDSVTITAVFTEADEIDETAPPEITIGGLVSGGAMTRTNNKTWTYPWTVAGGYNGNVSVSIVAHDRVGNTNTAATGDTLFTIDNIKPVISNVSLAPTSGLLGIGDSVIMTITTTGDGGGGLSENSITVNGESVTGFSDNSDGTYAVTYTVSSGDNEIAANEQIPVSVVLEDAAGNFNSAFTTAPTSDLCPEIDAVPPTITSVSYNPSSGWLGIGDSVTMTISTIGDGGGGLTESSITVNGEGVTGFTDNLNGTYYATYTVSSGDGEIASNEQLPVSVVLQDIAGNTNVAFTTAPASGSCPEIDLTPPTITAVSYSPSSGWLGIGDSVIMTITTTGDGNGGLSASSITVNGEGVTGFTDNLNGTYEVTYTVSSGDNDIDADQQLPVSIVLEDAAGNFNAAYTTAPVAGSCPEIDLTPPIITSVSFTPSLGWLGLNDSVVMTINTTGDVSGGLTENSITVNGESVTGFTDNLNGTYAVTYTVSSGDNEIASDEQIPVSVVLEDAAGNTNAAYTTAPAAGSCPGIDLTPPAITSVSYSPSSGWLGIGDSVIMTITTTGDGGGGLTENSITVNGESVTGFTDNLNGTYAVTYTVSSGDNGIASNEQIPVSVILEDAAGNTNTAFTTAPASGSCPEIDAVRPTISSVAFSPPSGWLGIGDSVIMTITTTGDGGGGLTENSITVNGESVTGFTDNLNGTYAVTYTVSSGDNEIASDEQIPVSVVLQDAAGNTNTAFTTAPAAGSCPEIDLTPPTVSSVSFSPSSGWAGIDDPVTMIITTSGDGGGGLSESSITVNGKGVTGFSDNLDGTYEVIYTVASGDTDIEEDQQVPVSVVLEDAAGNTNTAYTTSPGSGNCPGIDAHITGGHTIVYYGNTAGSSDDKVEWSDSSDEESYDSFEYYVLLGKDGTQPGDVTAVYTASEIAGLVGGAKQAMNRSATASDDGNSGVTFGSALTKYALDGASENSDVLDSVDSEIFLVTIDRAGNMAVDTLGTALVSLSGSAPFIGRVIPEGGAVSNLLNSVKDLFSNPGHADRTSTGSIPKGAETKQTGKQSEAPAASERVITEGLPESRAPLTAPTEANTAAPIAGGTGRFLSRMTERLASGEGETAPSGDGGEEPPQGEEDASAEDAVLDESLGDAPPAPLKPAATVSAEEGRTPIGFVPILLGLGILAGTVWGALRLLFRRRKSIDNIPFRN